MDKLPDSEIVKALECCAVGHSCKGKCPLDDDNDSIKICTSTLSKSALDLINRLQAENKELKKELAKPILATKDLIVSFERIYRIGEEKALVQALKAEAYKEFANWQEIKLVNNPNISTVALQSIIKTNDNLLKELKGND